MRPLYLGLCLLLLCTSLTLAAPKFPKLTSHVVDEAHVMSPGIRDRLERKLAEYENGTKNQIVVATLSSLQGLEIADYGYQLGRSWGIGQKGKDNGAILIVVPKEKKVRIEVGYGLEGTLTDAATSQIINTIIVPSFSNGHLEQGVLQGADAMIAVLGGQSAALPEQGLSDGALAIILILVIILCIKYPELAWFILSNLSSSYFRSGSGSSGGFRGGGGGFGGGGSSGSW